MMQVMESRFAAGYFYARNIYPMSVIIILLIASVSVASLFLAAFLWSVGSGQFEDENASAARILFEDKPVTDYKNQNV